MVGILHGGALVLYLVAGATLAGAFAGGRRRTPWVPVAAIGIAAVVHAIALSAFVLVFQELPLAWLAPSLSTIAFLIGGYLVAVTLLGEAPPLGLVLVPLIAILLVAALLLGIAPAGEAPAFRGAWGTLHVLLSFLGCAGLAMAFASGVLYLLQFRELKEKRFGRMFRFFPSLQALDRVGRHALGIGFASLTLGLLLGWAWTWRIEQPPKSITPEVVWGIFTWLILGTAMAVRVVGGASRDRMGALATVVGFLLVVLAYVVLRVFVAEGPVFL